MTQIMRTGSDTFQAFTDPDKEKSGFERLWEFAKRHGGYQMTEEGEQFRESVIEDYGFRGPQVEYLRQLPMIPLLEKPGPDWDKEAWWDQTSGGGGFWEPSKEQVEMFSPRYETYLHENMHAIWDKDFKDDPEKRERFVEAYKSVADPQRSEAGYPLARMHAAEAVYGTEDWFQGQRDISEPRGYNEHEMYAGFGSRMMGDMKRIPPELKEFYDPYFTGAAPFVGQQDRYWKQRGARPLPKGSYQNPFEEEPERPPVSAWATHVLSARPAGSEPYRDWSAPVEKPEGDYSGLYDEPEPETNYYRGEQDRIESPMFETFEWRDPVDEPEVNKWGQTDEQEWIGERPPPFKQREDPDWKRQPYSGEFVWRGRG